MRAPDLKTLYSFETNFEAGFALILVGVATNIYTQRQNVEKKSPRCELKFTLRSYTGHKSQDVAGIMRCDMWNFKLDVTFITDRQQNFSAHEQMIGLTRATLEDVFTNVNTPTNFPFYWVSLLSESGVVPGFHSEDDTDQSQINFTGVFAIRQGAWPVV